MKLAVIGLGRMGMGIARRLLAHGHEVVVYDIDPTVVGQAVAAGATGTDSLEAAIENLDDTPRFVWVMLPAGEQVSGTLQTLALLLEEGDVIMEGSDSYYKQSMEHAAKLSYKGIHMLDVGVGGGVWGDEYGFNLMVGGDEEAFAMATPIFEALAPVDGFHLVGLSGAGHFVKMAHDGIEYGIMQSIAEGFELMATKDEFSLDLAALADLWGKGSTIRSWLLELAGKALEEDANLDWVEPYVEDTDGGRWAVQEAVDLEVPLPVISLSLQMRYHSRQRDSYAARLLAALRKQSREHTIHKIKGE
ncbi:MAG: decarboxylating 6-phosphogluconate dehydrogenase [Anaerolineae bacterium]|nr:decarboxylating 6-phosphogluconate dehydrogenase [Anaerolineae bacterium]